MDRTAYLCGENVRILVHVENRQDTMVRTVMRLIQVCFLKISTAFKSKIIRTS